ncbi:hypothetical protein ES288_A02G026500v1 [Gossypium darwinii]|uniref:RING-type E3 ubiquitin transferase n=1 Tax=Gossypium darwinii TaxID=34276 RepID=A0A5D2H9J5_GOSDA|nr:hypothetical protein ES288_A02G026500v1 [Gossypium darwinii]
MASRQPQFQLTVHHCLTPNKDLHLSKIGFLLQIRTFLEDDWQGDYQDQFVLPEFVFGSDRHRNYVNRRLLEAGWVDRGSLERILDIALSDGKLILEKEKNGFDNMVMIIFRVKRIVMRGDDEIAATAAMELSMREDPKLIAATKESIQALTKAKLGEGDGDGDGDGFKCVICMEKLVEVVACMPCSHIFHEDCIKKWLNNSHLCPLCRYPMPTDAKKC